MQASKNELPFVQFGSQNYTRLSKYFAVDSCYKTGWRILEPFQEFIKKNTAVNDSCL